MGLANCPGERGKLGKKKVRLANKEPKDINSVPQIPNRIVF